MDFETDYWDMMKPAAEYENRKEAARAEWDAHPEKQQAIHAWLDRHGAYPNRNPYFFIHDFTVRKTAQVAEPIDYNHRKLPSVPVFSAKYKGKWGMYTLEDINKFKLETPHETT